MLLNRYVDLTEAIEEGNASLLDNSDFAEATNVPLVDDRTLPTKQVRMRLICVDLHLEGNALRKSTSVQYLQTTQISCPTIAHEQGHSKGATTKQNVHTLRKNGRKNILPTISTFRWKRTARR